MHKLWTVAAIVVAAAIVTGTVYTLRSTADGTPRAAGGESVAAGSGETMQVLTPPGASATLVDGHPRYPEPDDPEWQDYQEMMAHPHFRSVHKGEPGYKMPYDPDWRDVVRGRRLVGPVDLEFTNAKSSLDKLATAIVRALNDRDEAALSALHVNRQEFVEILWPEFPQSRPFAGIPAQEVWDMHLLRCEGGIDRALMSHGGRQLALLEVSHGEIQQYTNFALYRDVVIKVLDPHSHEQLDLNIVPSIAKRNGRFKAYIYRD